MSHIRKKGFTIVELIVVIACIAILATLMIFSYSTWRSRVAKTEVKNELINASNALKEKVTFGNAYPASNTLNTVYTQRGQVTFTYTLRSGGASYCLVGQSTEDPSVQLSIDSALSAQPSTTICS